MADLNGDTKVILHRLDQLGTQVGKLDSRVEQYHQKTQDRLRQCEIQTALLEQSQQAICKDVEKIDDRVENVTLLSKIFGGITGFLSVVAAIIAILGTLSGS